MNGLTPELEELLGRGVAFEEIMHSKGFELIQAYITSQIQAFTNRAVLEGFKTMEEFNLERGKVLSLRDLLGEIDHAVETLKKHNEPTTTTPTE